MDAKWRCRKCKTLLGTTCGIRMHVRYKETQYIVDGGDYCVIAVCRNCSTVNEWSSTEEQPRSHVSTC